jgi:hypothetical protein
MHSGGWEYVYVCMYIWQQDGNNPPPTHPHPHPHTHTDRRHLCHLPLADRCDMCLHLLHTRPRLVERQNRDLPPGIYICVCVCVCVCVCEYLFIYYLYYTMYGGHIYHTQHLSPPPSLHLRTYNHTHTHIHTHTHTHTHTGHLGAPFLDHQQGEGIL